MKEYNSRKILAGGTRFMSVGGLLFNDETSRINIGTGEDTLSTFTVPGGTMKNNGDMVIGFAAGTLAANGNTKTVRLYIFEDSAVGFATSSFSHTEWYFQFWSVRTSATAGFSTVINQYGNVTPSVGFPNISQTYANDLAIKVTGEGVSNSDIVQRMMVLLYYPANL